MTPEQNKTQQQMRNLILNTSDQIGQHEATKGWLRYEKIRTLNAVQFAKLQRRNLEGKNWDEMIDELIVKEQGFE